MTHPGSGLPPDVRREWILEEDIAYLNHGSFGATPRRVLEAQDGWRRRLERHPVRFLDEELRPLLRDAAGALATFLGARPDDLVFVENATAAVNAVVRSLRLVPGDEILTTSHVYGAVRQILRFVCDRSGARLVEAPVPFPLGDAGEVVSSVEPHLGPRTRLAVLDQVTSPTAVVLPLEPLLALCRGHGVPVLVDGAHGPGMLPVDLGALGADWYAGNAHKWLCAPKGCGFLWARPERQDGLHPTAISHGYQGGFLEEFDWVGTRDPSAWLAVTAALDFQRELGPERLREHNHRLVASAAGLVGEAWKVSPPVPGGMLGAMATLPLPSPMDRIATEDAARALRRRLRDENRVEVAVVPFAGRGWVRISAQVYNRLEEYERLATALETAS